MTPRPYQIAAIAMLALLCSACDSKNITEKPMYEPPLKPGQVLDKDTEYGKKWPGKPALFKLSDTMLLQIPPTYQKFWEQGDKVTRPPADLSKLPSGGLIGFHFFMPDFSGFTPDNYESEFHEDRVDVIWVKPVGMGQEQPGATGSYPPNMYQRMTTGTAKLDPDKYEEKYGLRCFSPRPHDLDMRTCYGLRDATTGEYILLRISVPPYEDWIKYPNMQAEYFSPQYGGVEILWRANMKHFARWQDIDSQIWKFIEAWNIRNTGNQPKTTTEQK